MQIPNVSSRIIHLETPSIQLPEKSVNTNEMQLTINLDNSTFPLYCFNNLEKLSLGLVSLHCN